MDMPAHIIYAICGVTIVISLLLLILASVKYHKAKRILKEFQKEFQTSPTQTIYINQVQTPELYKAYLDAVQSNQSDLATTITTAMYQRCHHSENCTKGVNVCPICRRYEH